MPPTCTMNLARPAPDRLVISLAGDWLMGSERPGANLVEKELAAGPPPAGVELEAGGVTAWDSTLLTFVDAIKKLCEKRGAAFSSQGLPSGAGRLLELAAAVPERKGARRKFTKESFLARVGIEARDFAKAGNEMLDFIGASTLAAINMLRGKAPMRRSDLLLLMQECGVQALPIVCLISLLVGLILAFVGAIQLMMFGAQIYVASLVGVAILRVMGAIMTGIIMAGRTGAAFAAQLGTMQVNEEIDALKTMGISPMEFLVLPRIFALATMMPLLCLFSDLMGVLGGLIVGVAMLDLGPVEYYQQTVATVGLTDFFIGIFQACIFGVLVAVAGCLRGMQCGRSASEVGNAATSAVVTGIVSIIVATALVTIICNVLGV